MSRDEVAAIAKAFAVANGHSHPEDYAAAVAEAFEPKGDVAEARADESAKREEG